MGLRLDKQVHWWAHKFNAHVGFQELEDARDAVGSIAWCVGGIVGGFIAAIITYSLIGGGAPGLVFGLIAFIFTFVFAGMIAGKAVENTEEK